MLGFQPVDYAKVVKAKDACEDIENNNNENKGDTFDNKSDSVQYSTNSKGVCAQVRNMMHFSLRYD